jgi:hypothetical protein
VILLAGTTTLIGVAVAGEFKDVGPTVAEAVDDIEEWVVEDGPFDIDRETVTRVRADLRDVIDRSLRGSGDDIVAGAILAGVVAVLVTLATASPAAAVIVAITVILLQQFDNDVLAPLVYGGALRLHPVVILLAVVAGGAALGIAGSVLAVPVTRNHHQRPRRVASGRRTDDIRRRVRGVYRGGGTFGAGVLDFPPAADWRRTIPRRRPPCPLEMKHGQTAPPAGWTARWTTLPRRRSTTRRSSAGISKQVPPRRWAM